MSYSGVAYSIEYATTKEECTPEFKSCLQSVAASSLAPILLQNALLIDLLKDAHTSLIPVLET